MSRFRCVHAFQLSRDSWVFENPNSRLQTKRASREEFCWVYQLPRGGFDVNNANRSTVPAILSFRAVRFLTTAWA
jgi:hypothetical protein